MTAVVATAAVIADSKSSCCSSSIVFRNCLPATGDRTNSCCRLIGLSFTLARLIVKFFLKHLWSARRERDRSLRTWLFVPSS